MITPLPTPPNKLESPQVFRAQVDGFFAALPQFVQECNALATELNAKILEIDTILTELYTGVEYVRQAQTKVAAAVNITTAGATQLWSVFTIYNKGDVCVSSIDYQLYRCKQSVVGGLDPQPNTTNWTLAVKKVSDPIMFVYGNKVLELNVHHVIVQIATLTIDNGTVGDEVSITNTKDYSISLNGFIGGEIQTVQIPARSTNYSLRWSGTTWGWV